ncbi:nitrilase family protein [Ferviditalea candida]|uniref:Nitrilase family protein n=1 Tax=Ferviditalea candida TaxID=3108399 RepID=A0ABU5ZGX9_9BACL|nr:nitrilase family protein [Paenibacillaceae bacterium T2]
MSEKGSPVNVACVQMKPLFGQVQKNVAATKQWIEQAKHRGADIVVLPELCNTGYVFESRSEAFSLAEEIPNGPTVQAWSRLAETNNVYIIAGIAEKQGESLYNSAVLIGPSGYIGTYRKNHLWYEETLFFEPGDLGFPVFQMEIGKIGMLICYDMWFPEAFRIYALHGVDLVGIPTNWVPMPSQPEGQAVMAVHLAMTNAHSNGMFVACADRVGEERGQPFIGSSLIVDPYGWPAAGPAGGDSEELVLARCNLSEARTGKNKSSLNHILRDRRPEIYKL